MFINIDHEKRPSDYKLHLAKPNKEIISVLHERRNSALNLKLGNISELNFSIPYFIEDSNLQMIKNPNIERIRELMYVKLTWGEFEEWFLIDNITESSEDNEIMNIQSFSIGYENKRKKINEFKETAINATEFYTEILKDSPWSIGEIDGSFDLLYRSFDESGTDRFELIKTGAETFGGVIVWDTNNKKINLKEPDNIGEFRGLTVSYDRLMSSLNKTRTTDEMVTRLYVYGNERITIENKNPTNEKYIEDYSYFMHPFKRDANKNVLESSYYMSDSLCHALLDNKELRDEYEPQIKTIQGNIENKNSSLSLAMIELSDAEFTLMSAKGLLDIAKAVDDKALIAQRKTEVSNATSIVNTKSTAVNNLTSQIEVLQNQVSVLQNAISVRSFTKELIDELEPYIIEKEIEDARYIDEDELYEFAKEKFSEIREPRVVIETGIEGLMNSVEEQYYWDKLVLGDTMRVRQKRMDIDYKSRIIEMNVGLDDSDVEVKIANFTENVDNLDKFISILYSSESNSTILSNNKHKWDSVVDMRDQVTQLRESEIDATKKRITAGVNESVEIGERGIVITTPSFPNEMIIMQAGVIALSEDGGETWKTSVTPNGVVAETVIGKLIAGNNLIITNDSGSIVMDGDGLEIESDSIKIMSGGENPKNLIDDWNNMIINMEDFANDGTVTPYEKSQISHQWNMISDSHSKIIESFVKNMGVETPENPYPHEYDDYLIAYENLKEYLFTINQSDGYTLLNPDRMDIASPIDIGTYRLLVRSFTSTKDNFILVMPMEYANAYMEVLESSISLNYVKNDEVVAKINLSEEGTRIDGKLLEINSRTEFNADLVMNAGLIQDANGDITIDLNKGEINLSKPLTINYVPIATKDDVENIEMAYIASLSNDTALVPTDEDGNEEDYSSAFTSIHIYQRDIDVTLQGWTFSATPSLGINGLLSGNDFTVTSMSVESGYVDVSAIKGSTVLTKRFSISRVRKGETGEIGPDGISPIVGFLTNESITLPASDEGVVPTSSFASATGTLNVYEGTVLKNESTSTTYSVVSQSGITVSITTAGVYTVSAMTTGASVLSGTATLRAVYGGVTIDKILTVTKALAGSQGATGATGGKGATGSAGQNATSYWINASVNAIKKDVSGNIVPNTITFSGFSKTGTSNPVAYSGRYIIQTSENGTSYTDRYTSGANQSSYTYTIPANAKFVKARLYLAGGTSVLLDEQTIPVLVDAEGIEVGAKNLLLKSNEEITNSSYPIATYQMSEKMIVGQEYTLRLWGTLGTGKTNFTPYLNGGSISLGALKNNGDGTFSATFLGKDSGVTTGDILHIYPFASTTVVDSTITKIKLEKGNVATDWTEAPEDVREQIGNKADIEVIDNIRNDLNDYTKQEDYLNSIGEVNSFLESYKSLLEIIERDLKGERDENGEFVLDTNGNPINVGAIREIEDIVNRESAIVNNLGELSERWNFIGTNIIMASEGLLIGETEVNASGKEVLVTGIRINKSRVDFVENGTIVAEITGQRMKINRAIFVQSISVGEHKIETVSSGHTIWTWAPIV